MWQSTRRMAEAVADGIREAHPETRVVIMNATKDDKNDIVLETFRSREILVGCPTVNLGMTYAIAGILEMIHGMKFRGKKAAVFSSFGWAAAPRSASSNAWRKRASRSLPSRSRSNGHQTVRLRRRAANGARRSPDNGCASAALVAVRYCGIRFLVAVPAYDTNEKPVTPQGVTGFFTYKSFYQRLYTTCIFFRNGFTRLVTAALSFSQQLCTTWHGCIIFFATALHDSSRLMLAIARLEQNVILA